MVLGMMVLIIDLVGLTAASDEPPRPDLILTGETQTELAPHGEGNVYAPEVRFDGGIFRMWYGGQGKVEVDDLDEAVREL